MALGKRLGEMMDGNENRQIARDSLFVMADLRLPGSAAEHRIKVRNLSAGGMMGEGAVRVARGDVVYAGAFYTSEHDRGPDLSMERAQAALANAPALAQRLRPAEYRNGEVFQCMGSYFYAYEVPGAPFRESYTHGSNHGIAAPMMGQASGAADSQQTSAESTVQAPAP